MIRRWWHRWRQGREMTLDWCTVCDRTLRRREVWEVRTSHRAAEDGLGGTFLSLTYCKTHRPIDARRAP